MNMLVTHLKWIRGKIGRSWSIVFVLMVSAGAGLFVYVRGQDRNWDLLNYHYYAGYSLLYGRYLQDVAAANLQSFFNPMATVFAYLSLRYLPFPFSAWSILLIQLLSVPAIVLIAREVGRALGYTKLPLTGVLALLLCVIAPLWWSELGTTFFSSWTSPLILWGFYSLLRNFAVQPYRGNGLALAGCLFGFAAGLKLTNAPFAVAAFVSFTYLSYGLGLREILKRASVFVLGGVVGFAATAWWNWHLWDAWANPVFPLYNAIFKSPYYDLINWRDLRWHFSSLSDFSVFIVEAASGSGKTSEVPFADPRYLAVALLGIGAMLCQPALRYGTSAVALLLFCLSGLVLWSFMLAYQRYLIPIELLLGLMIWLLVLRLVERERVRIAVMAGLVVLSAYAIKVPDWGHAKVSFGSTNPFSIEAGEHLAEAPARYIVVGVPISYLLPNLHPESVFYGVGFSGQVDELVGTKLRQPSNLPLRILSEMSNAHAIPDRLKHAGYNPASYVLECEHFKTGIARYVVCQVRAKKKNAQVDGWSAQADFTAKGHYNSEILWERGLSLQEPWGRWSEGGLVELGLANCLPMGGIKVSVNARAFGPNAGRPVKVQLGDETKFVVFGHANSDASVRFANEKQCANRLLVHIPAPTSPQDLGLSSDGRKLGIGFVRVELFRE